MNISIEPGIVGWMGRSVHLRECRARPNDAQWWFYGKKL